MPNPLVDELTPEAKAWLVQRFKELGVLHHPVRFERIGGWVTTRRIESKPWQ